MDSQISYKYSKIHQFRNKAIRMALHQMPIFEFNEFLNQEVEPNLRTEVQKIRRMEQIRINVKNYRKTHGDEVSNLQEKKCQLIEEKEKLINEIETYTFCISDELVQ